VQVQFKGHRKIFHGDDPTLLLEAIREEVGTPAESLTGWMETMAGTLAGWFNLHVSTESPERFWRDMVRCRQILIWEDAPASHP
jgi:hypothetical protein